MKRLTPMFARGIFALGLMALASGCASTPAKNVADHPQSRAKGDVLAKRMVNALGGTAALERLHTISFEWVIHAGGFELARHRHDWDRKRQLHRWRSGDKDVTHQLGATAPVDGIVMEGGQVVADPKRRSELLAEAFRWWTNNTYWLLSAHKVLDDNTVRVAVDGDGDGEEDELRISFDAEVGLTPGDAYIYFLDDTGAPEKFMFLLESGPSGEAVFIEEVTLHGVSFHLRKIAGPAEIRFEHLEVSDGPRDELFGGILEGGKSSAPRRGATSQAAASQPATSRAAASRAAASRAAASQPAAGTP